MSTIDRKDAFGGSHEFDGPRASETDRPAEARGFLAALRSVLSSPVRSAPRRDAWAGQQPRLYLLALLISAINLIALVFLIIGVLYVNQRSENLIAAHQRFLETQSRLIANVLAETAVTETDGVPRLDRELAVPIFRRLIDPERTVARLYNERGNLIADSNLIKDIVITRDLAPPGETAGGRQLLEKVYDWLTDVLALSAYYPYVPEANEGDRLRQAIARGLQGESVYLSWRDDAGELIVSYVLPVQPLQKVLGVLVLEVSDIGDAIRAEREKFQGVFIVAFVVSILASILLAQTIARPIRRLAAAAEGVRMGTRGRKEIPDLTRRRDEIGHLSGVLRAMTNALYDRIDTIESFAADVAHEIKNPLTSLRSAVETFEVAKTDDMRQRLLKVIKDDVGRIDRLISDISNASRLDAELARKEAELVNVATLLRTLGDVYRMTEKEHDPKLVLDLPPDGDADLEIWGLEDSLGQVLRNLVDNAKSFSPPDGEIRIAARQETRDRRKLVVITVEDQGSGIPEENLESVFERFYTQRPDKSQFGKHSGLGLSICRQIVEAHRGTIRAENIRRDGDAETAKSLGARFIVTLPVSLRD